MFRSFLPIALRCFPKFGKVVAFGLGCYTINSFSSILKPINCFNISFKPTNKIGEVLSHVIRVENNGEFVGYAFCFMNRYLVSTSPELLESKNGEKEFDFFIGQKKILTKFKIIGTFENLAFIEAEQDIVSPMHGYQTNLVTPVQIVQKRTYLSIKSGYFVTKDCGFGIVDGKGEIGSLVMNDNGVVGVVTQIGRDSDRGFLRMICWTDLKNILKRIKEEPIYLGISAKAIEEKDGIMVVRVASNSPLQDRLPMGSIITKVNSIPIKHPDDLLRVIMTSNKNIIMNVEIENVAKEIEVMI